MNRDEQTYRLTAAARTLLEVRAGVTGGVPQAFAIDEERNVFAASFLTEAKIGDAVEYHFAGSGGEFIVGEIHGQWFDGLLWHAVVGFE